MEVDRPFSRYLYTHRAALLKLSFAPSKSCPATRYNSQLTWPAHIHVMMSPVVCVCCIYLSPRRYTHFHWAAYPSLARHTHTHKHSRGTVISSRAFLFLTHYYNTRFFLFYTHTQHSYICVPPLQFSYFPSINHPLLARASI